MKEKIAIWQAFIRNLRRCGEWGNQQFGRIHNLQIRIFFSFTGYAFIEEHTLNQISQYALLALQSISISSVFLVLPKLYIPTTLNIDLILWHTHLIVCAENVKSWVFPFTFQAYILPHKLNCMCVGIFKYHIRILEQF